jgi:hypothetical protein
VRHDGLVTVTLDDDGHCLCVLATERDVP